MAPERAEARLSPGPLAFPSCASPQKTSAQLTVGTADSNGKPALNEGYLTLTTIVGVPGGPDDADVGLDLFMDDVFTNALADYTGELRAQRPAAHHRQGQHSAPGRAQSRPPRPRSRST